MIAYQSNHFGINDETSLILFESFDYPFLHFHRCFELVIIESGELNICIDGKNITLNKSEAALIFPNQIHSYPQKQITKGLLFIFAPEYVNLFYQQCINKLPKDIITKFDPQIILTATKKLKNNLTNKYTIKSILYAICGEIVDKTSFISNEKMTETKLQHKILTYIDENFTDEISLGKLALELGYEYVYLSRYFNKRFELSFTTMVNQRRINYALYLLKNSDESITSIALSCGFNSIRSFNRNFIKAFSDSPSKIRKTSKLLNN